VFPSDTETFGSVVLEARLLDDPLLVVRLAAGARAIAADRSRDTTMERLFSNYDAAVRLPRAVSPDRDFGAGSSTDSERGIEC
jgi:hypothetical protein